VAPWPVAPGVASRRLVGRAFGLALRADFGIGHLLAPDAPAAGTLDLRQVAALSCLGSAETRRIVAQARPDGSPLLTVDHHESAGYRIEAPGFGEHLLSLDGRRAWCVDPDSGSADWHRLLFAQVLPTAAALQGLEVLHASAVAWTGEVTGFVAPSGTGKSSLSARLAARGAEFVTDDVLALATGSGHPIAHPGPAFALRWPGSSDGGTAPVNPAGGPAPWPREKRVVSEPPVSRPLPLTRLCFLEFALPGAEPGLDPLDAPDPRLLLASTFVAHIDTAGRLEAQLNACSELARTVACFRLRLAPGREGIAAAAAMLEAVRR